MIRRLFTLTSLAGAWLSPMIAAAATINVTTTSSAINAGDGVCSLPEAVTAANTNSNYSGCTRQGTGSADTIRLGAGTYNAASTLSITSDVTISGAGQGSTTIALSGGSSLSIPTGASIRRLSLIGLRVTAGGLSNCVVVSAGLATLRDATLESCYIGLQVLSGGSANATSSKFLNNVYGISTGGKLELLSSDVTGSAATGISVGSTGDATIQNGYVAYNRRTGISVSGGRASVTTTYLHSNHDDGSRGGGIRAVNGANLQVASSTIAFNESTRGGGGINSEYSEVRVSDTLIDSNFCYGSTCIGGGIRTVGSGGGVGFTLTDSNVVNNLSQGNGGGVGLTTLNGTAFMAVRSSISKNTASNNGGGLYSLSQEDIIASTISGNVAGQRGGGVYHEGSGELHIFESTVAFNEANETGGMYVHSAGNPMNFGNVFARNTSTVGNRDLRVPPGFPGGSFSWGTNLLLTDNTGISSAPFGAVYVVANPRLGPLTLINGRFVHPLLSGSPAIDQGFTYTNAPDGFDNVKRARPVNGRVDLGAIEFAP